MAKQKKKLTDQQEFEILKLVLDKFLWIGVLIMGFGFYRLITAIEGFWQNLFTLIAGVVVMLLFTWILMKEYHIAK